MHHHTPPPPCIITHHPHHPHTATSLSPPLTHHASVIYIYNSILVQHRFGIASPITSTHNSLQPQGIPPLSAFESMSPLVVCHSVLSSLCNWDSPCQLQLQNTSLLEWRTPTLEQVHVNQLRDLLAVYFHSPCLEGHPSTCLASPNSIYKVSREMLQDGSQFR